MPSAIVLHIRLDSTTAAYVRLEADGCGSLFSEWIAAVLRREFHRAGAADALAAKTYEMAVVSLHLLHALMIDSLGRWRRPPRRAEEETAEQLARAAAGGS